MEVPDEIYADMIQMNVALLCLQDANGDWYCPPYIADWEIEDAVPLKDLL